MNQCFILNQLMKPVLSYDIVFLSSGKSNDGNL
jgi:hypothetical protein